MCGKYFCSVVLLVMLVAGKAWAQTDTCAVRCPNFAPLYNSDTFMCQERGVEPIALENIIIGGINSIPKVVKYLFGSLKREIEQNKRRQGRPDCNHSASYYPQFKPDLFGKAVCASQYKLFKEWAVDDKPYNFKRRDIQFTVWCIGTYGVAIGDGDFPLQRWKQKLNTVSLPDG
ncbi:hypothetical protein BJ123_1319 [Rhodopseudomonas thermotolerans]|uniref:Uncharacterized protein n=2 Tax=Rhodopseudomonas TaxID=1073 RepID=A0A336JWT1_9BRAD|nr:MULTISPECIES: hypothetical protein [Rhodopseudomonas]RED25541.1 hypothetical protein BJ125_1319 [Rhodopseudomonas pentothenatexigens]REF90371.1 hypothetical protein BJ123_1319 [Rhodopseudomonas thermotolerans]SSW93153.1 hypothetical protein SAMN05892882_1319 [Rhodopseudomonas pentothenatexigens]